jgi:hypothetical protein
VGYTVTNFQKISLSIYWTAFIGMVGVGGRGLIGGGWELGIGIYGVHQENWKA